LANLDDQPSASPPPPAPEPEAPSAELRGNRSLALRVVLWLLLVLTVLAAAGAGLLYYVVSTLPERIRAEVTKQARDRGLEVTFQTVRAQAILPWEDGQPTIVVEEAIVTSEDFPGVETTVQRLTIPLRGTFPAFEPERVEVLDVSVDAATFAALLAVETSAKSGGLSKTPTTIDGARLKLRSVTEGLPLPLAARVSKIELEGGRVELTDVEVEVPIPFVGFTIGPSSAEVRRESPLTRIRLADYPFLTLTLDDEGKTLAIDVDPSPSAVLEKIIRTKLPETTVSAHVEVEPKKRTGSFRAELAGWIPPHPPEASGILFGKSTTISGSVRVDGFMVYLNDLRIKAGAFELKGVGSINLATGVIDGQLKGAVACADAAVSAAGSRLGRDAALLTGMLARGRLGGSVHVVVNVDGKLSDLENLRLAPSATIACKISI
jgi:hypothetical protein